MMESFKERGGCCTLRIMVAKISQDGHDRGAKGAAHGNFLFRSRFQRADIGALFWTPGEVASEIAENDAHVIGMSAMTAGHKTLLPELAKELKGLDRIEYHLEVYENNFANDPSYALGSFYCAKLLQLGSSLKKSMVETYNSPFPN